MIRSKSKRDNGNDRNEWMRNLSSSNLSRGKRKFFLHKNANSNQYQYTFSQNSPDPKYTKIKIRENRIIKEKKDASIQVFNPRVLELEKQLKEKQTKIDILQTVFEQTNQRLRGKNSVQEERSFSLIKLKQPASQKQEKILSTRTPSLPSLKINRYLELSNHPAFTQPKFTKNHPKLIISNPII